MSALKKPTPPTREGVRNKVVREHEEMSRDQAVRFTRGNVSIQKNAFLTKKESKERLDTYLRRK